MFLPASIKAFGTVLLSFSLRTWLLIVWTGALLAELKTCWMARPRVECVMTRVKSDLCPVTSAAPQGSGLGTVLSVKCSIPLSRIWMRRLSVLSFAELGKTVDLLKSQKALQRDLERLDLWTKVSWMRFSKVKCWVRSSCHNKC